MGQPNDAEYYEYIRSYSPYDNVRAQDYPPMLVTGGISDPRVTYWEAGEVGGQAAGDADGRQPAAAQGHMDAGHAGASGRFERIRRLRRNTLSSSMLWGWLWHKKGTNDAIPVGG